MRLISNMYERAVALLAGQFQGTTSQDNRTNFQKMIFAILTQAQAIQDQEYLLFTLRSLNTGQGAQLDGIGQIVGLARIPGQPDDSAIIDNIYVQGYREDLQFQVYVNTSSGTPEQVIQILQFLTKANRVWYVEVYPAAYQMATDGLVGVSFPANPSDLVGAIQNVSPAAVHFLGITATYNVNPFTFCDDPFNEQFYVNPNPDDPSEINPFEVNPGAGLQPFFIQRGETVDPNFGGGFAEAILLTYPVYTIDTTGAGQLAEFIA